MEAERSAIAAEIHDGLLPYLYAAAAKLAAIRRSTHADSPSSILDERLADAANWIDQSREIARTLMSGITYPPQALADPLAAAQSFLSQFDEVFDVIPPDACSTDACSTDACSTDACSTEVCWQWGDGPSPLADRLSPATAIAIYRLTTECVRNALRHAKASRVEISAAFSGGIATVQIQDNGCGFRPDEIDSSSSHGLTLARRRAEAGGVDMQLETGDEATRASTPAAPSGTRVTLRARVAPHGQPSEEMQPRSRPTHE